MIYSLPNWDVVAEPLGSGASTADETLIWQDSEGPLAVSELRDGTGKHYRLRQGEGVITDVRSDRQIVERSAPSVSQATRDHFFADQVLPRVMAHDGDFILHAGAVRSGDVAILLMGTSGQGKSTLATSFDQAGLPLLGDDAMVISWDGDRAQAKAVYPSLRLLPDSIAALFSRAIKTTSVADYTPKQRLDVPIPASGGTAPLPIRAIVSIGAPSEDERISLRRLSISEACMALIESSFALDPTDLDRARTRLNQASAIAAKITAFEISYPRDYARLPEVRQAILDQLAELDT